MGYDVKLQMLTGNWRSALQSELIRRLGSARASANGRPDISRNALKRMVAQHATAYVRQPYVGGMPAEMGALIGDFSGPAAIQAAAARGMLPMPTNFQAVRDWGHQITITCGESWLFALWGKKAGDGNGGPVFHVVSPGDVKAYADSEAPAVPVRVEWARTRNLGAGDVGCLDIWDVKDPERPMFAIKRRLDGADITAQVLGLPVDGPLMGDAYPWRWTAAPRAGRPYIPGVLYHRIFHGGLYLPSSGDELEDAAMQVAVLWNFWVHCVQDASWPQRWAVGAHPASGTISGQDGAGPAGVPTDPASVVIFEDDSPDKQGRLGQWSPGSDPKGLLESILSYEQTLGDLLLPLDYSSTPGDPLAARQQAYELVRQRYLAGCRAGDAQAFSIIAAQAAVELGTRWPETGYTFQYEGEMDTPDHGGASTDDDSPDDDTTPEGEM